MFQNTSTPIDNPGFFMANHMRPFQGLSLSRPKRVVINIINVPKHCQPPMQLSADGMCREIWEEKNSNEAQLGLDSTIKSRD